MRYFIFYKLRQFIRSTVICFFVFVTQISNAQLAVSDVLSPTQLVQDILLRSRVTVSNMTYTGGSLDLGSFCNGQTTNLGLTEGIVMTTGSIFKVPQQAVAIATIPYGTPGDPDLEAFIPGSNISYDALGLKLIR